MPQCSQCKTETELQARIPLCQACVDTPLLYFVVKIDGQFAVLEFTPKQIYARSRIEPAFVNCLDDLPFAKRAAAEDRRDSLNASFRGSATRALAAC
jgi:hypothetical protein